MSTHVRTHVALFLLTLALAGTRPAAAQTEAPYPQVTDNHRGFANLNVEAVRGIAVTPDGAELYALNVDESTIVEFANLNGPPVARWRTLLNPVSIVIDGPDLLVVGQGTHALARHDRSTGFITDVIQLASEPADIVLDPVQHQAWISCMGSDVVEQIALTGALTRIKTWGLAQGLAAKRPRFLQFSLGDPDDPDDDAVFVAPLVSGNNTLITTRIDAGLDDQVLDGKDLARFPAGGLPDVDLFRIRPAAGLVEPVVVRAGSLLTGHGRNPVTGDYWMLGVDELNLLATDEPTIRGRFAENRLAMISAATFPAAGASPVMPSSLTDLDDNTPATPQPTYSASTSLSFPYALAFHPTAGWGVVGASTSPLASIVGADGHRRKTLELSDASLGIQGLVLRTLEVLPATQNILGYCQQSNNVLVWSLAPFKDTPVRALALGNDPAPAAVKRGRATWYDGTRSLDGRTSCNTCHPQGGADGLVWQISNVPVDQKGPMVTQPLLGIEDSFPYHWRGERSLPDFNDAFPGLLGTAAPLDPFNGELDDFLEFVFSLTPPANPRQDLDRRLKNSLATIPPGTGVVPTPLVGSPVSGADDFVNQVQDGIFGNGSCASCHMLPTGSNGDFFADKPDPVVTKAVIEVVQLDTHFTLKDQALVNVLCIDSGGNPKTFLSQALGSGILHDGRVLNLFAFVDDFFGISDQRVADITTFLQLFDSGTAPGVHAVMRLAPGSPAGTVNKIRTQLLGAATQGSIGVVLLGTHKLAGGWQSISWYYDALNARFVPEDLSVIGVKTLFQLNQDVLAGNADLVFLGVPPGNERRVGVDADDDGLDTGTEVTLMTDPWNPDTDGDGWLDGHEVANGGNPLDPITPSNDSTPPTLAAPIAIDFVNGSLAKLVIQASEPVTWSLTMQTPLGQPHAASRRTFDTLHTALVHGLEPSTVDVALGTNHVNHFTGTLVLTDLAGNASAPIALPALDTATMVHSSNPGAGIEMVVGDLQLSNPVRTTNTFGAHIDLRIDLREESPAALLAPDRVVIAQLLRQAANGVDWEIVPQADILFHNAPNAPSTSFLWGGVPYNALPGPFLVLAPTVAAGTSSIDFTVTTTSATQKVLFNVLSVLPVGPSYDPLNPAFFGGNQRRYQMPATPKAKRNVVSP